MNPTQMSRIQSNRPVELGMVQKISSLCTSKRTKLSLTMKTDDITSSRKDVDLHRQLQAAQGRMG